MALSVDSAEILAFVTQHNPSKSRVFALVRNGEHCSGYVRLEAVATISQSHRADELCAALNQFVLQKDHARGFQARLRSLLSDEPESVHAAIQQMLDRVRGSHVHQDSPVKTISPFAAFPLSACPATGCPACGECVNHCSDCEVCDEYDEGCECLVEITPRTAALLHTAALFYCDLIHDLADEMSSAIPHQPHDELWPVPESAYWQNQEFYRRFARAFEDIARDIEEGELPEPRNMAEEIALHLLLDRATGIVSDNSEELELWAGGMPESRFDFDFDLLHSALFQDKDYEVAYLDNTSPVKPGGLDHWFEDFGGSESRDPNRGFHR
jgi:hypothetical protein